MTHIDQYVLGLAVSSTPCFGYHEQGNATCADCPVASSCATSWRTRASTVAAQLVKTERAARRAASAPAAAPTVAADGTPGTPAHAVGESIDDILDSISKGTVGPTANASAPVPPPVQDATDAELEELFGPLLSTKPAAAPAPAPSPAAVVAAPSPSPRVTMMKAVIDSVCFSCGGRIPAKSDAAFIPGKGVRHPGCP